MAPQDPQDPQGKSGPPFPSSIIDDAVWIRQRREMRHSQMMNRIWQSSPGGKKELAEKRSARRGWWEYPAGIISDVGLLPLDATYSLVQGLINLPPHLLGFGDVIPDPVNSRDLVDAMNNYVVGPALGTKPLPAEEVRRRMQQTFEDVGRQGVFGGAAEVGRIGAGSMVHLGVMLHPALWTGSAFRAGATIGNKLAQGTAKVADVLTNATKVKTGWALAAGVSPATAAQLVRSGKAWEVVADLEKAGGWARHALRLSEMGGRGYRQVLAASGAVGLHELINASGDDNNPNFHNRYAGALAAASTGFMLVAAERGGTAVTNWLKGKHKWKPGSAKLVGKFIETTGFVGMEEHNRDLFWAMIDGDMQAAMQLSGQFLGTYAGLLGLSRGLTPDRYKHWRKDFPEMNNLQMRREAQALRNSEEGPPPPVDPILDRVAVPLLRAGMEVRGDIKEGRIGPVEGQEVTLLLDGNPGSVRLVSNASEVAVEVDSRIWNTIRGGEETGMKRLVGEPAREFFDELAMAAMRTRMAAGMIFSREGEAMIELEDGRGRWLRDDGHIYQIGLDGMIRRRELDKTGSAWEDVGRAQVPKMLELTTAEKEQLQPWLQVAEMLRNEAVPDSPISQSTVRLFDTALQTALRGRRDHPWVAELNRFLTDKATLSLLDQGVTPSTAKEVAWWMGAVATGNSTAAYAQARIVEAGLRQTNPRVEPKVDEIERPPEEAVETPEGKAVKAPEVPPEASKLKATSDALRKEVVKEKPKGKAEEAEEPRKPVTPESTVRELRVAAKEHGVEIPKGATKAEIVDALRMRLTSDDIRREVEQGKASTIAEQAPSQTVEIKAPTEAIKALRQDIEEALIQRDVEGEGLEEVVRLDAALEKGGGETGVRLNREQAEDLLLAARDVHESTPELQKQLDPVIQQLTEFVGKTPEQIVQSRIEPVQAEKGEGRVDEPASEVETAKPPQDVAIDIMTERDWSRAPMEEKKEGAFRYIAAMTKANETPASSEIAATFHVSVSTAKNWRREFIETGEVGAHLLPIAKLTIAGAVPAVKSFGQGMVRLWRYWWDKSVNVFADDGGSFGKDVANILRLSADKGARLEGELEAKVAPQLKRMSQILGPNRHKVLNELAHIEFSESGLGETIFAKAVEGRLDHKFLSQHGRDYVEGYGKIFRASGKMAVREIAPLQLNREGKWEPFTPSQRVMHLRYLDRSFVAFVKKGEADYDAFVDAYTAHTASNPKLKTLSKEEVKNAFQKMAVRGNEDPLVQVEGISIDAPFEHSRRLEWLPTHFKAPSGAVIDIQSGTPMQAYRTLINRHSTAIAYRTFFAQDGVPIGLRRKYGQADKMTPSEVIKALGISMQAEGLPHVNRTQKWLAGLMREASGLPFEEPYTDPSSGLGRLKRRVVDVLLRAWSISKLTMAWPPQIPETAGSIPMFFGTARYLRALAKVGLNPRESARLLERSGAVNKQLFDLAAQHGHTVGALLEGGSKFLNFPHRKVNQFSDLVAGMTAEFAVRDMLAGRMTRYDEMAADLLEFSPRDVQTLRTSETRGDLHDAFVRRAVAHAQPSTARGVEKSRSSMNRAFTTVLRFQTHFGNKARQLIQLVGKNIEAKGPGERYRWGKMLAGYAVGNYVAGALANTIVNMVTSGGDWEKVLKLWGRGITDWRFHVTNVGYATFGGALATTVDLGQSLFTGKSIVEQLVRAAPLASMGTEQYAFWSPSGGGAYRGTDWMSGERLMLWAQRSVPIIRSATYWGIIGSWEDTAIPNALRSGWRAIANDFPSYVQITGTPPHERDWRRVSRAMREKIKGLTPGADIDQFLANDKEFKETVREALEIKRGSNIAASLRGMQFYKRLPGGARSLILDKLTSDEIDALTMYDQSLEQIAKAIGGERGPAEVLDFDDRIVRAQQEASYDIHVEFKSLVEESLTLHSHEFASTKNVNRIGTEYRQLAAILASYPEAMREVLGERYHGVIFQMDTDQRRRLLENIWLKSIVTRGTGKIREEAKARD